jgi:hypothetical protein
MSSEWRCGKCSKEYTFDEFIKLPKVSVISTDPDPKKNYGFTSVCSCGYIFHKDKWHLKDTIKFTYKKKKAVIDVSTIFLELNHFGFWYETMLFEGKGSEVNFNLGYQRRYVTKEEAEKNHKKIVAQLKNKKFKLIAEGKEPVYDIEFKEEEK